MIIAQQTADTGSPAVTLRITTSLTLVDVVVQDRRSELPIRDLGKEDFRVLDNGREAPITSFDSGARFNTRPIALWFAVSCGEQHNAYLRSGPFAGKEHLFRPSLDGLDPGDRVGVAHWCDNGDAWLDLRLTDNRDRAIQALTETLKPIPFVAPAESRIGEVAVQSMLRLIILDARQRIPEPLPVVVFLHEDYTGMPAPDLELLMDDLRETSGVVFGIRDASVPEMGPLTYGQQGRIFHLMAEHTGGQYFSANEKQYAALLDEILRQLHFRYELGFKPAALDGKRHKLEVRLIGDAARRYQSARLRFRQEYIPLPGKSGWLR